MYRRPHISRPSLKPRTAAPAGIYSSGDCHIRLSTQYLFKTDNIASWLAKCCHGMCESWGCWKFTVHFRYLPNSQWPEPLLDKALTSAKRAQRRYESSKPRLDVRVLGLIGIYCVSSRPPKCTMMQTLAGQGSYVCNVGLAETPVVKTPIECASLGAKCTMAGVQL
jgi:hypothetical protein